MYLSYRYRLYPFPLQRLELDRFCSELRFLWNYALDDRLCAQRKGRRRTYLDQQARLKDWRTFDSEGIGSLPYGLARDALQRLDLAFRAAFGRLGRNAKPGFPRFRSRVRSFTFVAPVHLWTAGPNGRWRLLMSRLGAIPVRRHRDPPANGSARTMTVRREAGQWYVTIQYEVPDPLPPDPTIPPESPVAVDLGIPRIATLSSGGTVESPGFRRASERRLVREQRRLARRHRGSHRREIQRDRVARVHATVARQRRDFAHRLTSSWARRHDLVIFEDLNVGRLAEGNRLAGRIADAGWGRLRSLTEYKLALRSRRYLEVDARDSSQTCADCGRLAEPPLSLEVRVYRCPCGHEEDRDRNAARVLLQRGLREVRRNTAELTRGERAPPPARRGRRAYSGSREGPTRGPPALSTGAPILGALQSRPVPKS